MRPLRYSINVTLDGCCHHEAAIPSHKLHLHAAENIAGADAIILGRSTFDMMESAWHHSNWPNLADWMLPFARSIDQSKKYLVSSRPTQPKWDVEFIKGDLKSSIDALKNQPGNGLFTGGVMLPTALAELGLIDEFEFVIHPVVAGYGPTLFAGLAEPLKLKEISCVDLGGGVIARRYVPIKGDDN